MIEEKNIEKTNLNGVDIVEELETSFIEYSMSVIVSRALPDLRDGLKPVQRRILYAMYELGMLHNTPYKKSARVVGEVLAKYHPHGDSSVYEAMVRMSQDFSLRYPLVDGQGNFGSIDGDGPAAMRYTEVKMKEIAEELLLDIDKETVNFVPNYDGEENEPSVLPSRIPSLLLNGSIGIAVGMSTSIPPHNLNELLRACIEITNNPLISNQDLLNIIKGPDFPTGGFLIRTNDMNNYQIDGKGKVVIRSKCQIIPFDKNREQIIITEIPYMIQKSLLVSKISDLIRFKKIDGISDLRDESNYKGIRIVIELKKDVGSKLILNKLYRMTPLQNSFSINMLALKNNIPSVMSIKEILINYIDYQKEILIKTITFDLKKAKNRLHLLKGLKVAIINIDQVVLVIKKSSDVNQASSNLQLKFDLSNLQAKAILDMRLQRLTSLEIEKIDLEIKDLEEKIIYYENILNSEIRVRQEITNQFERYLKKYSDERRTQIIEPNLDENNDENLIPKKYVIIIFTKQGYVKRVDSVQYRVQNRATKGSRGITTNEDDEVIFSYSTNTHTDLLIFTNLGKVYRIRAHQISEGSKQSKGIPIQNIIDISEDEKVNSIISIEKYLNELFLLFITTQGNVKKVNLTHFNKINRTGKIALKFKNKDDKLLVVKIVTQEDNIILGNSNGNVTIFKISSLRELGRSAAGVKGIGINGVKKEVVIGASLAKKYHYLFSLSKNGFGKLSKLSDFKIQNRATKGIKAINVKSAGSLVAIKAVNGDEDLLITTNKGTTLRISLKTFETPKGRNTKGVSIIKLKENETINAVEMIRTQVKGDDNDIN